MIALSLAGALGCKTQGSKTGSDNCCYEFSAEDLAVPRGFPSEAVTQEPRLYCSYFLRDDAATSKYWPPKSGWSVIGLSCDAWHQSRIEVRLIDVQHGSALIGSTMLTSSDGAARMIVALRSGETKDDLERPTGVVFIYSLVGRKVFEEVRLPAPGLPRNESSGAAIWGFEWFPASQSWEKANPEAKPFYRSKVETREPVLLPTSSFTPIATCEPFGWGGHTMDAVLVLEARTVHSSGR